MIKLKIINDLVGLPAAILYDYETIVFLSSGESFQGFCHVVIPKPAPSLIQTARVLARELLHAVVSEQ